jgi:hypothetical protein
MARPKKISDAQIKEALFAACGVLEHASKALGCTKENLSYHISKKKYLREYMDNFLPTMIISAENNIREAINNGNLTASMFFLKCKGGYNERHEIDANVKMTHEQWVKELEEPPARAKRKKPSKK